MSNRGSGTDFHERITELREVALQLLEECSHQSVAAVGNRAEVIVALQGAANNLGSAQAGLASQSPSALEPAPVLREPQRPRDPSMRRTAAAASVLALAETTVARALSRADEAERWLRLLRLHGRVGAALQAVGVADRQLSTRAERSAGRSYGAAGGAPVALVADEAADFAGERGADAMETVDVLFAVIARYGSVFDRALYEAGTSRQAVIDALPGLDSVGEVELVNAVGAVQ